MALGLTGSISPAAEQGRREAAPNGSAPRSPRGAPQGSRSLLRPQLTRATSWSRGRAVFSRYRRLQNDHCTKVTWPNGAVGLIFNATEPDQLRGPQFTNAWCDELAKWQYAQETWDQLQFGLRAGPKPRVVITTTTPGRSFGQYEIKPSGPPMHTEGLRTTACCCERAQRISTQVQRAIRTKDHDVIRGAANSTRASGACRDRRNP
jgi:Terminase large subunit, T4likevirus-type, N-terminal